MNRYWVFRSWGRISTTIGGTKLDSFHSLEEARDQFEKLYEDHTGNYFGEKKFVKYPGKYYKVKYYLALYQKMDLILLM